jgi:hypothetical protein
VGWARVGRCKGAGAALDREARRVPPLAVVDDADEYGSSNGESWKRRSVTAGIDRFAVLVALDNTNDELAEPAFFVGRQLPFFFRSHGQSLAFFACLSFLSV